MSVQRRPRSRRTRRALLAAFILGLLLAAALLASLFFVFRGTTANPPSAQRTSSAPKPSWPVASPMPSVAAPIPAAETRALLETLEVKGRASKTGYSRAQFGLGWVDVDGNQCDTRNDILARDLTQVIRDPKTCRVTSGTLVDLYSGRIVTFVRGAQTSDDVQIDHVVSLSDAWQKGAQSWDQQTRERFAQDPVELQAVEGETNSNKGSKDAATWLPPNKGYRCAYVTRQVQIKSSYGLWVTPAEKDAILRVLEKCP